MPRSGFVVRFGGPAAILLATLCLVGCASAPAPGSQPVRAAAPRAEQVATATYSGPLASPKGYPEIGITMTPPPVGVVPNVSWTTAANACKTETTAVCGDGSSPSVTLAVVSSPNGSRINADATLTPTISNELAYVIVWPSVACIAVGPAGVHQTETTCLFVSLVDATTGKFLGAGQTTSPEG